MIMICALQKMRKLFELSHTLLSVTETWQMHGRSGCNICYPLLFVWVEDLSTDTAFCLQEKGNIDLAIRYYLVAIEVCMR